MRSSCLLLALVPGTAFAGVDVDARVEIGDAPAVAVHRHFSREEDDDVATETVFHDPDGDRCELLLDADEVGAQTFVALAVRCRDPRGHVIVETEPNLLVADGKPASIRVGSDEDGAWTVSAEVTATADDSEASRAVRRSVFARRGVAPYRFYRMSPPWEGLTCESKEVTLTDDALVVRASGRYHPGDRLELRCTAEEDGAEAEVPVVIDFF
jgi:hypothetical protein